jgi:hypothetical protein
VPGGYGGDPFGGGGFGGDPFGGGGGFGGPSPTVLRSVVWVVTAVCGAALPAGSMGVEVRPCVALEHEYCLSMHEYVCMTIARGRTTE